MSLAGLRRFWPLLCLVPYLGWWTIGLTDLDEGFYGAVVADMMRRGDWITPSISGTPWFEKPILLYWLAIPSVAAFGEAVGPRLPSVAASLILCWLAWKFCRRWVSPEAAVLAPLMVSGSLLMAAVGRMMLTDALLAASFAGCLFLFWESLHGKPSLRVGAASLLGLGVLAKGPVAGLLFIVVAVLAWWRLPSLRPGFKGWWLLAAAACLAVIAAWYVPCWLVNREVFVQKFLIEQNLGRFAGGDEAHSLPHHVLHVIYYPAVLAVALLPWLPGAIRQGLFRPSEPGDREGLTAFLWIWALTILVFFYLSGSKLPHYIVPALPPLAILAADRILRGREKELPRLVEGAALWSVFVLALALAAFQMEYSRQKGPDLHALVREIRTLPDETVIFGFGGGGDRPKYGLKINETSRPSIHFYLRRPAREPATIRELVDGRPRPLVILTPAGRLGPMERSEAEALGLHISDQPDWRKGDFAAFRAYPMRR